MFIDALTLDAPRRLKDGYLAVRAKAARTGTYSYDGREIDPENKHGLRDAGMVNVLRDDKTVFDEAAVRSFIGKPITDDHPSTPITAANWRDNARGMVMGAMRDGDYLAFDLLMTDATAIAKVDGGKRELSNGYTADLEFGDFIAPDGTACVARQASIFGNHVALVDAGRAGSECRIKDAAVCDAATVEIASLMLDQITAGERTYSGDSKPHKNDPSNRRPGNGDVKMHVLVIDGLQVAEVSDQAKAAIEKLQAQVKTADEARAALDTKVAELTAQISTKDGEIAALTQKVKDAELSPAQLEKLVADRSALIAQAKAIDPNIVTDGKTEGEIRKAVVTSKLGDAAKDLDDAAIGGAFKVIAKDVKIDQVRNVLSSGGGLVTDGDARAEYDKAVAAAKKNLSDAWKGSAKVDA